MTDLQRRIADLPPEKRELLERQLAKLAAARAPAPADQIKPRDRAQPIPLSFQQEREWAFAQFQPANNVPAAFQVEGELDLGLIRGLLTEIVERHEVLRSTVELPGDGTVVQVVRPAIPVPTPVVDLSALTPEQQHEDLARRWMAEVERPFDQTSPLRIRTSFLRLAEDNHAVLITTDHVAADVVSVAILMRELATLYALKRAGDGHGLPPPAIQYSDFAAWQREIGETRIAAEMRYWRQALDGVSSISTLPSDRPLPAHPTFDGALHIVRLSPELSADLHRLIDREKMLLSAVLLATCSVLWYRYLGQDDIVIGEMVSGRSRVEVEQLVGCFVTPLPMRMRLADGQTLHEVLRQAQHTVLTAHDHQDVSIGRLTGELQLGNAAAQTSLSHMWIDVGTPEDFFEVPGLRISRVPNWPITATVPITLHAHRDGDTPQLHWRYMTEMFDADTVALFAKQFNTVLHHLITAPDTTVSQVDLAVTPASSAQTRADAPSGAEAGFVELFQRRVALAPHAPAVICDGVATSFGELNRDANLLAHQLRARGVGRDTRVAVLVERSPLLAVAILGVLKAGGAYVPLDPADPPDRMAFMLADAGVRVLVTQQRLAGVIAGAGSGPPEETVLLDGPSPLTGGADQDPPEVPDPRSLAYVIYTSGSTGRPKGAMIEHRSLVTFAREVTDRLGLGAGDRFLQFASPSFDVLVEELFPTWLAGAAVVIPTQHLISGGVNLADVVERERLTVMELPTAYWHEWVRELDRLGRQLPTSLRLVIIGGERVLPDRLAMWRRQRVPLMHVYGLTETTVSSTFFRLDPADPVTEWSNLPIGIALPSAHVRILDRRLRPVPVGGTGELYVEGISVARGYAGRPGLTAERFIADPDASRPGGRVYRTGDLVRQRADGNLEFLSRVDTQIKIRGFRVEPVEIESAICRHPRVAESVVDSYEPAPGDRRLVAYVVPHPDTEPDVGELRGFLASELPAYLVPSVFVRLDAIPLTATGKIDRGRLPEPDGARPEVAERYVAPESPVQRALADVVAAVIGLDKIGIHDNFFEIGGDSILAIQVVARARETGLRLTPYDLFAHQTVAALAEVTTAGPTVDAEQGDVTGPVPLVSTQRWFCTAGIEEPRHWNTAVLLELRAPGEPELLRAAVSHLLAHHDGLRQRFLLAGERTRVRIAPRGDVTPFEVHDLSDLDEAEQAREMPELARSMQTSLDLAVGPLVRVALIRLGAGRPDRLAVVAHRLAVDEVSLRVLVEDLGTALEQLVAGSAGTLPAKTTSWQSWARRLAAYAATPRLRSERDYWSDLVTAPAGALPFDTPDGRAADTVVTARTVATALDATRTEELLHAIPDALYCRVEELLLTALSRTLSDWSGSRRHLVDLVRHDREQLFDDVDLTRTVGWFSRSHPVALTCEPGSSAEATLKAVKEALRTVPSGGIGWQLLRQDPDPVPDAPVDLAFTYLGRLDYPGGLTVSAEPFGTDGSPRARRQHAIEVQAQVAGGTLTIRWRYSESLHQRQTVTRLAASYLDELRGLIERGRDTAESVHTPHDFPLARTDQAQLDALLNKLQR